MITLIESYAERLEAAGRSRLTITTRCRVLRHAHRVLPRGLEEACGDEITAYLARRRAPWTKATVYSHLHGFYSTAVKLGWLSLDPTANVDRPQAGDRLPNPVSDAEVQAAIERSDPLWRLVVLLASYEGLRCAECALIERDDITEQHVHVCCGKGGRGRFVPTHPLVWDAVRDQPPGTLIHRGGQPLSPARLSSLQRRHWTSIGLDSDVHLHRFRHWFGTTLVDRGVGIEVVKELMGHARLETTLGYVRSSTARRAAAISTLPDLTKTAPASLNLAGAVAHSVNAQPSPVPPTQA